MKLKRDLKNEIISLKSYLKQDDVAPYPNTNFILFQLDFNVKFPLLRLLQFLADLKRTILGVQNRRLASKENEKES